MPYFISLLSSLMGYRKCPKCGKGQQFKGKKKGDTVTFKKCGQVFELK
jgi:uncharacterized protein (DUF983 family)